MQEFDELSRVGLGGDRVGGQQQMLQPLGGIGRVVALGANLIWLGVLGSSEVQNL